MEKFISIFKLYIYSIIKLDTMLKVNYSRELKISTEYVFLYNK